METHMQYENYTNVNIFKNAFESQGAKKSLVEGGGKTYYGPVIEHASQFNPYVNNQGTTLGKHIAKWIHSVNQVSLFFSHRRPRLLHGCR